MSLESLKPEGWDESMRIYSQWARPATMYVQGFFDSVGVWLSIEGFQTLIGHGLPDEALAEAEAWMAEQLESVRKQIAARKARGE